jgi:hypothetical protein
MKSDIKMGGGLFHEDPIERSIIMLGKLKEKDIKELVKAARDGIGDLIEEEAIKKIGDSPITVEITIEMDDEPPPLVESKTDTSAALRQTCRYICITYGGSTRCYKVCY